MFGAKESEEPRMAEEEGDNLYGGADSTPHLEQDRPRIQSWPSTSQLGYLGQMTSVSLCLSVSLSLSLSLCLSLFLCVCVCVCVCMCFEELGRR